MYKNIKGKEEKKIIKKKFFLSYNNLPYINAWH